MYIIIVSCICVLKINKTENTTPLIYYKKKKNGGGDRMWLRESKFCTATKKPSLNCTGTKRRQGKNCHEQI